VDSKWLYLAGGVLIGWWYFSRRPSLAGTLKVGDKGKDIENLQRNINKLRGQDTITEYGAYDKKTGKVVKEFFEGTMALRDPASGRLDKNFVSDFNIVINRV